VVDVVPEAVLVTEPEGALRFTNDAADRLFADRPIVDREDLLSRFEPVEVDRADALPSLDRPDARGDAVIVRQRSRPTRWFALKTVPLNEGSKAVRETGVAGTGSTGSAAASAAPEVPIAFILRDVTDSRDLRPVREAFLGLVSHELRTPITTIYAGSSVLARQPSLSPPATRTLARDVSAEAARLYDLVEDLLVLARIERGVLDPLDEPIHLERILETTGRLAAERHKGARIRRDGSAHGLLARGDATYTEQACRNVVLGALRRPGLVDLECTIAVRAAQASGEIEIAVLDRGPILSRDQLDRIFDLPDASPGPQAGVGGLGLFVARQVVEAMGGRTWAANRDGDRGLELGLALRMDAPAV